MYVSEREELANISLEINRRRTEKFFAWHGLSQLRNIITEFVFKRLFDSQPQPRGLARNQMETGETAEDVGRVSRRSAHLGIML